MVGVRPDGNTAWGDSWAVAWRALLASRVVVLVAGALAAGLLGLDPRHTGFDPAGITTPYGGLGDALVAPVARWDTTWFVAIAQDGYGGGAPRGVLPALSAAPGRRRHGHRRRDGARRHRDLDGVRGGGAHRAAPARRAGLERRGRARGRARDGLHPDVVLLLGGLQRVAVPHALGRRGATRRGPTGGRGRACSAACRRRRAARACVLLVPLVLLWWDAQGPRRGARSPVAGARPRGRRGVLPLPVGDGRRPAGAVRRAGRLVPGVRGAVRGRVGRLVAAWEGARQLLSGSREPVFFTPGGGDPFVVARHNIELFAWLVRRALGARDRPAPAAAARTSPTSSPRWRCRSPIRSCPSRSCRCHASCSCCSRSPSPSQPGRRSGGGAGRARVDAGDASGSRCTRRSSRRGTGSHETSLACTSARRARHARRARGPVPAAARRAAPPAARRSSVRGGAHGAARGDRPLPRAPRRVASTSTASRGCARTAPRSCAPRCRAPASGWRTTRCSTRCWPRCASARSPRSPSVLRDLRAAGRRSRRRQQLGRLAARGHGAHRAARARRRRADVGRDRRGEAGRRDVPRGAGARRRAAGGGGARGRLDRARRRGCAGDRDRARCSWTATARPAPSRRACPS